MIVRMKRIPGLIISLMVSFAMMVSLLSGIVIMPGVEARAEGENVEVFISSESNVGYEAAKAAKVENHSVIEGENGENAIHSKPKDKSFSFYVHYYSADGYSINDIELNAKYSCWDESGGEVTKPEQIFAYSESNNTRTETIEEVGITASKVESVSDGNLESVHDDEQEKKVTHLYQKITVNQTAESWMDLKCNIDDNTDIFIVSLDVKKSRAGDPLLVENNINDLNKKIEGHDKTVGEELYQSPGNAAGKGFVYLGKAYYYTSEVMYPDVTYEDVLAQNNGTYDKNGWTFRGIYDSDGNPRGSHIFFQYYLVDKYGNMRTDDDAEGSYPVSYLVYDEFPEDKTRGKDVAQAFTDAFEVNGQFHDVEWMNPISGYVDSCQWTDIQGDGTEVLCPNESYANVSRTFGSAGKRMNFYNIWGVHGSITVYGDVIGCMALDREKYAGMYYSDEDNEAVENGEDPVYGNYPGSTRWYIYKDNDDYNGKEEETLLRDQYHDLFEKMYKNYNTYGGDDESYLYDNLSSGERNTIKSHQRYSDQIIQDSRLKFSDSSVKNSTVVIDGDVGFIDLHDTWEGKCTIGNGYSFGGLALYDTSEQLFKMNNMAPKQYYSTVVGDGTPIISGGKIAKSGIQPLKEGQSIEGNMYGIDVDNPNIDNFNSYTSIQGETFGEEYPVPATSSGISGYGKSGQGETGSITIGVSGFEGNENTINPMVRKKKDKGGNDDSWQNGNAWWKAIVQALNAPEDTEVAMMDIALVEKRGEDEKDNLVEPGDPVDLYFDFDLSTDYWKKLGNEVVLYHVKDNGQIEKLPISKTAWDGGNVSIVKAQTGSFSTFFFAEDMNVPSAINQDLAKLAKAQHDADVPKQLPSNGGNSGNGGNPGGGGGSGSVAPVNPSTPAPTTAPSTAPATPKPTIDVPSAAPTVAASMEPISTPSSAPVGTPVVKTDENIKDQDIYIPGSSPVSSKSPSSSTAPKVTVPPSMDNTVVTEEEYEDGTKKKDVAAKNDNGDELNQTTYESPNGDLESQGNYSSGDGNSLLSWIYKKVTEVVEAIVDGVTQLVSAVRETSRSVSTNMAAKEQVITNTNTQTVGTNITTNEVEQTQDLDGNIKETISRDIVEDTEKGTKQEKEFVWDASGKIKTAKQVDTVKSGSDTKVDTIIENADGSGLISTETTKGNGTVILSQEETKKNGTVVITDQTTQKNGNYSKQETTKKSNGKVVVKLESKKGKDTSITLYDENSAKTGAVTIKKHTSKDKTLKVPGSITANGEVRKVTEIAGSAFKGNKTITKADVGDNVKVLGKGAFQGDTKLSKATLGTATKTIGANAFRGDKKLKSITIETGKVTSIGENAFKGINKKAVIKIDAGKKDFNKLVKKILKAGGAPKGVTFKRI